MLQSIIPDLNAMSRADLEGLFKEVVNINNNQVGGGGQIIRFVISAFTPIFFIEISFVLPPPPTAANGVDLGCFCFLNFLPFTPDQC